MVKNCVTSASNFFNSPPKSAPKSTLKNSENAQILMAKSTFCSFSTTFLKSTFVYTNLLIVILQKAKIYCYLRKNDSKETHFVQRLVWRSVARSKYRSMK